MRKVEILAPAGSYESMTAAVNAKADAIYIGGSKFGARAFANNLTKEDMLRAIDYTHIHERKLYLTINTLLKNKELENELYEYLYDYYIRGIDAVIVQDVGAMSFIHRNFPDLPIHASTQMTLTMGYGTELFKNLGVTRFVTSRELSLDEIKSVRQETDLEIEAFVHGALCYCYSGQCLMSSMIGGRSGNRGRCAQPCRMKYTLKREGFEDLKDRYILSPKDMCTLRMIPELISAGINSFKIEGRMKRPEYTAYAAYIYGHYVDLYEALGLEEYRKYIRNNSQEFEGHAKSLMDLYNRGGFSGGYYDTYNGKTMMSMERPNHNGVKAGKIINVEGNTAEIKLSENVNAQDILEIRNGVKKAYEFTLKSDLQKDNTLKTKFLPNSGVKKGQDVYRTRNARLLENIRENFIANSEKIKIDGEFIAETDKPIKLIIKYQNYIVNVTGAVCEAAKNQPITNEKILKQLNKTNDTEFIFENLKITLSGDLFIPVIKLNELRRDALDLLYEKIISSYERKAYKEISVDETISQNIEDKKYVPGISVMITDKNMLDTVLNIEEVDNIYIDMADLLIDEAEKLCKKCCIKNKKAYLVMPHIMRKKTYKYFDENALIFTSEFISGFIIRNFEEAYFIRKILKKFSCDKEIITDYNMYVMNKESRGFWNKAGIGHYTLPMELNYREFLELNLRNIDMVVYGYIPSMVSAQCILKNTHNCIKRHEIITITDRADKNFYVSNHCNYCYNTIYNGQVFSLLENSDEVLKLMPENIRINLTLESAKEAELIVKAFADVFKNKCTSDYKIENFTRGHFKRGIE